MSQRRRIVSLVPSLTETLVAWGLRDEIVACTKFCVSPRDLYKSCEIVGGTKDFDVEKVLLLNPTHILCNQEENPKLLVEQLQSRKAVYLCFPKGPEDVPEMMRTLGVYLNCEGIAFPMALRLESLILDVKARVQKHFARPFLYFIWRNPYMIVGEDTYISRLFSLIRWQNAYQGNERYPVLNIEDLPKYGQAEILFSTEPFPFKKRHAEELHRHWSTVTRVWKVDGQLLSWYGVRTLEALGKIVISHDQMCFSEGRLL